MKPTDLMPFGKHKGIPLKDVPKDYISWLIVQEGFKDRSPALYAFFARGEDIPDPKAVATDKALSTELLAIKNDLLNSAPEGFKAWWQQAYGRLDTEGPNTLIPYLRVAIEAWRGCATIFYDRELALRRELKAMTAPVEGPEQF